MARKTSIYLPDDLAARWKASGLPLAEIVRRGLDAVAPVPNAIEEPLRRIIREELAAVSASPGGQSPAIDCPHPKPRITKGLCGACGTNVSAAR